MSTNRCSECGATFAGDDSCEARFNALLALDHSRREPWGSRHGLAFAAFALQHPLRHAPSLDAVWAALLRIYTGGETDFVQVFVDLRRGGGRAPIEWRTPARPTRQAALPAMTIADLGDFDAATYPELVNRWCRAALAAWGITSSTSP